MDYSELAKRFLPDRVQAPVAEQLRSGLAAMVAVVVVAWVASHVLAMPLTLVAAVGASSALVFGLPMSPLAQPWPVVGSYLVSAVAGVAAARWVPGLALASGVSVGAAIVGMLALRCLHPPGGAVALFAVIGGDEVRAMGFHYVVTPVLVNAVLLVLVGLVVNNLLAGRHYPRRQVPPHAHAGGFTEDDLKSALHDYGHPLAASEEELDAILELAERRARARSQK
jgi:CBS domain-containing membrane protein